MINQQQTLNLKFIPNVNIEEFEDVLLEYKQYLKGNLWVRIPALLLFLTIVGYNIVIVGKSYTISDYNNIQNTMGIILGFIVIVLIIAAIMMIKRQLSLGKKVKKIAQEHSFPHKEFKKEVNFVLKSFVGGRGI